MRTSTCPRPGRGWGRSRTWSTSAGGPGRSNTTDFMCGLSERGDGRSGAGGGRRVGSLSWMWGRRPERSAGAVASAGTPPRPLPRREGGRRVTPVCIPSSSHSPLRGGGRGVGFFAPITRGRPMSVVEFLHRFWQDVAGWGVLFYLLLTAGTLVWILHTKREVMSALAWCADRPRHARPRVAPVLAVRHPERPPAAAAEAAAAAAVPRDGARRRAGRHAVRPRPVAVPPPWDVIARLGLRDQGFPGRRRQPPAIL